MEHTKRLVAAVVCLGTLFAIGNVAVKPVDAAAATNYATITKKGYSIWQDSSWKKSLHSSTNWYHHTIKISSKTTKNGSLYYRLSKSGKYFGMINADAVKTSASAQGAAIGTNKYVSITKKDFAIWNSFGWNKKLHSTTNWLKHTVQVKYIYYHSNGSTYYSLYRGGKWFGYLSATAVTDVANAQGNAINTTKQIAISSKTMSIWSDFSFKSVRHFSRNYFNKSFAVRRMYYHANGNTYYSLYNNDGSWFGYINATGTKSTTPALGTISLTKPANTKGWGTVFDVTRTINKDGQTQWLVGFIFDGGFYTVKDAFWQHAFALGDTIPMTKDINWDTVWFYEGNN